MRSRALPGGQSEMLHLWRLFFVVMVTRAALASAFGTTPGTTNSEGKYHDRILNIFFHFSLGVVFNLVLNLLAVIVRTTPL